MPDPISVTAAPTEPLNAVQPAFIDAGRPPRFAIRNLSLLSYARGFTLWHYRTGPMPLTPLTTPGFFDSAQDMLCLGDMIILSGGDFVGTIVFVTALRPQVIVSRYSAPCEAVP